MRLSRREWVQDVLIAALYLAAGAGLLLVVPEIAVSWRDGPADPPLWPSMAAIAVASLGEVVRRRLPVIGLVVATVAVLYGVLVTGSSPIGVLLAFGDLLYCAVRFTSRRTSWAVTGTVCTVVATLALLSLIAGGGRAALVTVLNLAMLLSIPVFWGYEVRRHSEQADIERERAEQAHRMAELDRAAAVAGERARMARDLHDVIAGQLSGIAIQSEAALNLDDPDPATLRRVLTAVRRDSLASLTEMRAMIGLLRADGAGDADPRTSPAGLDRLGTLLEAGRASGLRIEVDDRRPDGVHVPAAVDLAAFRIVQESLTNAAKHAPGSEVHLCLDQRAGELVIELDNNLVPDAPPGGGTGTGLLGLGERATAVGGNVRAGADGLCWRVRAALPVPAREGALR
ncbi:histidine kinase [Pseudonocardia aurantiaca]|uniref:histidine kinase n=1 Tax=Pseudonocardia aurantiaca TaxID=75290 RepID=A0ABW4FXJ4_9PSEU